MHETALLPGSCVNKLLGKMWGCTIWVSLGFFSGMHILAGTLGVDTQQPIPRRPLGRGEGRWGFSLNIWCRVLSKAQIRSVRAFDLRCNKKSHYIIRDRLSCLLDVLHDLRYEN